MKNFRHGFPFPFYSGIKPLDSVQFDKCIFVPDIELGIGNSAGNKIQVLASMNYSLLEKTETQLQHIARVSNYNILQNLMYINSCNSYITCYNLGIIIIIFILQMIELRHRRVKSLAQGYT